MSRIVALAPGLMASAGMVSVYLSFDAGSLPREIEGVAAIAAGLVIFAAMSWAAPRVAREENRIESQLEAAGLEADHATLRTARIIEDARARLANMQAAVAPLSEDLRISVGNFASRMEDLFEDMIASPESAGRADDLLRRTLPRIEGAVTGFAAYARKGDGVVDTDATRHRLMDALLDAGSTAVSVRRSAALTSQDDVEIKLEVLESTLASQR